MDLFALQLLLSFVVGGTYIAATIWLAEKFGSKIGGLLLGLPSTALVSLAFIGWTQGTAAVESATLVMPVSVVAVTAFLVLFQRLQRHGLVKAYAGAIMGWFVFSLPLVLLSIDSMAISVAFAVVALLAGRFFSPSTPDQKTVQNRFDKNEFLARAAFCGLVIAVAVFLAKTQGPVWGGVFSMFPAAFSSSIILLWHKQGARFTGSVVQSMMRARGPITVFIVAAHYAVGPLGLAGGLAAAYGASVASAIVLSAFK